MEMAMEKKKQVDKVPVLPPGLPFLHSLACHKLYTPGK